MEKAELIIKVVMAPHEHAEEFLASYSKLMHGDSDVANFQKVLEMKVRIQSHDVVYVHIRTYLQITYHGYESTNIDVGNANTAVYIHTLCNYMYMYIVVILCQVYIQWNL